MSAGGVLLLVMTGYGAYVVWNRLYKNKMPKNEDEKGAVRLFVCFVVIPILMVLIGFLGIGFLQSTDLFHRPSRGNKYETIDLLILGGFMIANIFISCNLGFRFEEWIVNKQKRKDLQLLK